MPLPQVQDLADTRLAQKISQVPGVGLVSISGGQRPAVRIQANPKALAAYDLTLEDLRTAIANANVNQAKGSFDGPDARLHHRRQRPARSRPTNTRRLIVAYRNGAPVRLSDVADVVDGAENTRLAAWVNDTPAVILNIQRQPGANVIEVVDRIKRAAAAASGVAAGRGRRRAADRPHRRPSARRCATCSSSCCSPSRWS